MSKPSKIAAIVGLSLAGLLLVLVVAALIIVRTDRFQNFVRDKIIASTEEATGGKVDLDSFAFDWSRGATARNFVIHGTEPAGAAPLFRARQIHVELRLLSGVKHAVDLRSVTLDEPRANIIVYPDGTTNIPEPKVKTKSSDKTGLDTVVDLAIGKFEIRNGAVTFASHTTPIDARGENLTAQLFYNVAPPSYRGRVSIEPLYIKQGRNAPLRVNITVPVVLGKDRIDVTDAQIATPESQVIFSGSMDHLVSPRSSVHVNARLSLKEASRFADIPISAEAGTRLPGTLDADVMADADENTVKLATARLTLGRSNFEGSGTLKDPSGHGTLQFHTALALEEFGRLFRLAQQPGGMFQAEGNAKLLGGSEYLITGNVHGRDLSFRQGKQRIAGISVVSAMLVDPRRFELNGLRLDAFGGQFAGDAGLENSRYYHLAGQLRNFDVRSVAKVFGEQTGYSGVISGPVEAQGDLKAPGASGLKARTRLAIAPGRGGVPVSGRIAADYRGETGAVQLTDTFLALPHSRLDLAGSLGQQIRVRLRSKNLDDFLPAVAMASSPPPKEMPVRLENGSAEFEGAVAGSLDNPKITGHLKLVRFALENRAFDRLDADLGASRSGASVQNALLSRGTMQARVDASAGMRNWKPEDGQPLRAQASIRNADLADLMAIAGQKDVPVSGGLTADANLGGTVANPTGAATLTVVNGSAYDEPFDRLDARVDFSDQVIALPSAEVAAGKARLRLTGTFRHPQDTLSKGLIQARLDGSNISLADLRTVQKQRPGIAGEGQLNADVSASLDQVNGAPELRVTGVNGDFGVRGLRDQGRKYGDLAATARTSGNTVGYRLDSDFAGSAIRVRGQTRLQPEYPTTANASIDNLPIEQVLAVASKSDIPIRGMLSGRADVNGAMDKISANADVRVVKAVVYGEPIDRMELRATYTPQSADVPLLEVVAGPSRLSLRASYSHAPKDLENGRLLVHVNDSTIHLAQLRSVQKQRPGLGGTVRLAADGVAEVRKGKTGSEILFSTLNLNLGATGLEANKKQFGDLRLAATTRGNVVDFNLDSTLAGSSVHGRGQARLLDDYPLTAELTFANLKYSGLQPLISSSSAAQGFDALAEGRVTVSGPTRTPDAFKGALELSRVELTATPAGNNGARPVTIRNDGPVVVALDRSVLRVDRAHFTGPSTGIRVAGAAPLQGGGAMNFNVSADTDLSLLHDFDRSVYSAGKVVLQAGVRGTASKPVVNGELELRGASFNMTDLPNGLSNANGLIVFTGDGATIEKLTVETGGGKLSASGSARFLGAPLSYELRANAKDVRVRYPEGASVVADADVQLTGGSERSLLSGAVTVNRIAFSPRNDFGSMLSRTATPPQAPAAPKGPLAGMRLDVRIRTSPNVSFLTPLADSLQVNADLRLRGSAANPGMTGRANITRGELVFFGTKYTVNQGSVAFYNPLRIAPVLDVDLQTVAKGVEVTLNISGPVEDMKLTYHSDPPLQFSELLALLATGKAPASDPTIIAREPATPPQTFEQMGESALVSQAVANPVASRLERVFGVNKLKIDPSFTGGSELPQARMTLQQQITRTLTFTYITNLTQTNDQIIRVEWAINDQWSAIATREENGQFGVDFFYKKQFR